MQRVILWGFFVPEKEGKSNHKNPSNHRISIYHFIENSWLVHEKHPQTNVPNLSRSANHGLCGIFNGRIGTDDLPKRFFKAFFNCIRIFIMAIYHKSWIYGLSQSDDFP